MSLGRGTISLLQACVTFSQTPLLHAFISNSSWPSGMQQTFTLPDFPRACKEDIHSSHSLNGKTEAQGLRDLFTEQHKQATKPAGGKSLLSSPVNFQLPR